MMFETLGISFADLGVLAVLVVLLASLALGLIRSFLGPAMEDRFTALLLLGTGGTAMLLLLAVLLEMPALYDVALVLASLAIVITVALTRRRDGHD